MSKKKRPNVIMIVADQWRWDSIGYSGNTAVQTPRIDELVEDGVGFSNAYAQNPVCVPSRNSFLSGRYPHTLGHRTMHYLADESEPNILRTIKEAGYHVYWGGRNDVLKVDQDFSNYADIRSDKFEKHMKENMKNVAKGLETPNNYSHFHGIEDKVHHADVDQIYDAINYLQTNSYEDDPFCMYLALSLPHPPYIVDQEWYDKISFDDIEEAVRLTDEELQLKPSILQGIRKNQEIYKWTDEELKKIKHVYYAMGSKLDYYIGELLDTVKEKDLYDDTIIIFFSDHGDYTGDYEIAEKNQNTFEDMLTRVPLVIKPALNYSKVEPRISDALVELIDIQATLLDYLDINPEYTHFGKSLKSVLEGDNEHRDVVFSEGGRLKGENHAMDAGHNQSNPYWARTIEQEKMPEHTKAMMIRDKNYKYVYRLYEEDEFYDLENDPRERKNQINNPMFEEEIAGFQMRMLKHFFETADVVPFTRDERF